MLTYSCVGSRKENKWCWHTLLSSDLRPVLQSILCTLRKSHRCLWSCSQACRSLSMDHVQEYDLQSYSPEWSWGEWSFCSLQKTVVGKNGRFPTSPAKWILLNIFQFLKGCKPQRVFLVLVFLSYEGKMVGPCVWSRLVLIHCREDRRNCALIFDSCIRT